MDEKTCFVICPLGDAGSGVRERSNQLLELVLRPVLKPLGYQIARADLARDRPTIPDTISQHILGDDLVIADLTGSNANVFYELGKRHAWNGPCVHFTTSVAALPFDLRHYRVLEYRLDDAEKLEDLRRELRLAVLAQEKNLTAPEFPPTPDDVIRMSGHTVVVKAASGRDEPYYTSEGIATGDCRRMLLMQRSSSLILGPEQGWGAEEAFYRTVLKRVKEGVELLHVVSLDGIVRHLQRPQSTFPKISQALDELIDVDGLVAVRGKDRPMYIKQLREREDREDFKLDRQARVFLVERPDRVGEGNFVIDIGNTQCSFHLRGPEVDKFKERAINCYYNECEYIRWNELVDALGPYRPKRG